MRRGIGEDSWRIDVSRWDYLLDHALWIRAAERIDAPAGGLVPAPLHLDPPPTPPTPPTPADRALGEEWVAWWRTLVDAEGNPETPSGVLSEPAYDTPDPLGLARRPALRTVVARRWREANDWHSARALAEQDRRVPPSSVEWDVIRDVERTLGRPVRPFHATFVLLPVREDTIRHVRDHRYLVPEQMYDGPRWPDWVRDLVRRIG
jgi:hypothetical protein